MRLPVGMALCLACTVSCAWARVTWHRIFYSRPGQPVSNSSSSLDPRSRAVTVEWDLSEERYVRVVRLASSGWITLIAPTGPVERKLRPGHHALTIPNSNLEDLMILLSDQPLGGDVAEYPARCPAIGVAWVPVTTNDRTRDDAGVPLPVARPGRRQRLQGCVGDAGVTVSNLNSAAAASDAASVAPNDAAVDAPTEPPLLLTIGTCRVWRRAVDPDLRCVPLYVQLQ